MIPSVSTMLLFAGTVVYVRGNITFLQFLALFGVVKVLPSFIFGSGGGGGASVGKTAHPLDESVKMLQGQRPAPGTAEGQGSVIVIERWATWCPPCVSSIPHLNKLYQKYKDRDVQFIGVTSETGVDSKLREFMAQHKMAYPVGVDTAGVVAEHYPSRGIPNATVVGKNGKVYWTGHPMSMDQPLQEAVEGAVAGADQPDTPDN